MNSGSVDATASSELPGPPLATSLAEACALPSREAFERELNHVLDDFPTNNMIAVLLIDIDGVSDVSRVFGHEAGIEMLGELGMSLQISAGPDAVLARFDNRGYLALISDISEEAEAIGRAEELSRALREPRRVQGLHVRLGTSIGIAVVGEPGRPAAEILRDADIATHDARNCGLNLNPPIHHTSDPSIRPIRS